MSGCKDKKQERVYRVIPGVAKSVDPASGKVSMEFTHPDKGTIELVGVVTQETEIIIDGRVAKLEDVKMGEDVEVTGYKVGEGTAAQLVVVKVSIERPKPIDTSGRAKATTQPASAPAKAPTSKPAK